MKLWKIVPLEKMGKYKVGDRVYAPYHGYGTVTAILSNTIYPIEVTWDIGWGAGANTGTFTSDGHLSRYIDKDDTTLSVVKEGKEEMKKNTKFKVGDKVVSRTFGTGVVREIVDLDRTYPVIVKWDEGAVAGGTFSAFTSKGWYYNHRSDTEKDIELLERGEKKVEDNMEEELKVGDRVWLNPNEKGIITFICPDKDTCIVDSELDGEVEAVMAGLTKVEYSPINPSHYQVAGIPEAIEIMEHLMTKEQLEGFLWGNILKYAYRYGRKGDKKETAGKIEWYAKHLKDIDAEGKKK